MDSFGNLQSRGKGARKRISSCIDFSSETEGQGSLLLSALILHFPLESSLKAHATLNDFGSMFFWGFFVCVFFFFCI